MQFARRFSRSAVKCTFRMLSTPCFTSGSALQVTKHRGEASTARLGVIASIDAACGVATVQWDSGRKREEVLLLDQLDQMLLRRGGLVGHIIAPVRAVRGKVTEHTLMAAKTCTGAARQ